MLSRRCLVAALVGSLTLAAAPWPAAADKKSNRGQEAGDEGGCLPLKRVIKSVRQQFSGRVLDAGQSGGGTYWIRLLTNDGQVLDISADCASGKIIDVQGGG
jgi:uncharacterized membrane protein YkoI